MLAPLVGLGKGEPLLLLSQHPDYTHRPGSASFQTNSGPMFRIATRGNIQTKACHSRPSLSLAGKKSHRQGARPAEAHPV